LKLLTLLRVVWYSKHHTISEEYSTKLESIRYGWKVKSIGADVLMQDSRIGSCRSEDNSNTGIPRSNGCIIKA